MWREYSCPQSVDEALAMLAVGAGQARVIAGGTDLILQLQRGERNASHLVDVSRIEALRGIREAEGFIVIGAAVTHSEVASSRLIRDSAAVLAQAAAEVGSLEIRNVATMGGNVVNAQPAADTALALLVLDAEAEILSLTGAHWVPLADLYEAAGVSMVDSTSELVRAFRFRPPLGQAGSAYRRLGKCKSIALPVLCAATVVTIKEDHFESAAIGLGPVAPRPLRARSAESYLAGAPVSAAVMDQAAILARRETDPRDSLLRCAKEYREEMVAALVRSTLLQAVAAVQVSSGSVEKAP